MEARASLVCIVASFKHPISRGYYHLYIILKLFVILIYTMERRLRAVSNFHQIPARTWSPSGTSCTRSEVTDG